MASKQLSETASKNLWKTKKADAIAFESELLKPIEPGEYTLLKFIATEGAIKNSDAITFHYDLGNGLKLYTKHINGTTIDDYAESYVESGGKHYLIPKDRERKVLASKMSELSGEKVRISQDTDGAKVKFVKGGYLSREDAEKAFALKKVDKIYKVEFIK